MAVTPPSPGPPVPTGAAPGRLLAGRYRLDRVVASGGMAQVWQATDEVLRRQVAVKVLHPHLAADDTFVHRFRREAVAAARLAHPSIVAIYDTCTEDTAEPGPAVEAIVMELVQGKTLRERLDEGPIDPWQAAGIAAQVADALEVAHRAGLVHRDIKPANVLLCDDGRVKVADFGIAKAAEGADLTHDGLMVGTAKYLAPEQVTAAPVDARTDLYSLGIVLYEMVTGRPPFQADTDAATALARLTTEPMKPRQVRAGVPRDLEAIITKAMAREPDARFASAADLRGALLAASSGTSAEDLALGVPPTEPDAAATSAPAPRFTQSERAWLVPTLLVVLIAVSLITAGLLLTDSGAGDLFNVFQGRDDPPAEIDITASEDFDPNGDADESHELVGAVRDGDATTSWQTERYNNPDLVPLKGGVGIAVALETGERLDLLEIDTPSDGWTAQVYVAGSMASTLEGWGEPVATVEGTAGTVEVGLRGRRGDSVLVWFTNVGTDHRVEISELRVLG